MMKHEIYIISNGKLFCDKGTIGFVDTNGRKVTFPLRNISDIFCMGSISLTSGIIKRVLMNNLNIHFLTKYGTYQGSLSYTSLLNGRVIKNQVIYSLDPPKRILIAKEFLLSLKEAMRYLLIKFSKKHEELKTEIKEINTISFKCLDNSFELMGYEAMMWKHFYNGIRCILSRFNFEKREYYPPKGEINAMISFGNMLLYSETFSIIKEVGLLPEIGFLHESNEKRYTLAIDISEMFKPMIVFSTIIYLVNKNMITEHDFTEKEGYTYLNEEGKYTFLRVFKEKLNKIFFTKELNRKVSLRFMIKRECQKLKSLFDEGKPYVSYKRWYECI